MTTDTCGAGGTKTWGAGREPVATGVEIRFGRLALHNAYGSELLDLPMPFRVEYWQDNTYGWTTASDDVCTGKASSPVSLSLTAPPVTCAWDSGNPGQSGAGCVAIAPSGRQYRDADSPGWAGSFNLWLKAPGTTGSVLVTGNVPDWLKYKWTSSTDSNPSGRATFGRYSSRTIIHRRELY